MTREEIIQPLIAGKDVLDIGSVGQTESYRLWHTLKAYAKSLAGIDTQAGDDGRIVVGNMETYDFGRHFDVVVAGDVIEHVDNQGLFLDNIHRHLHPDGRLILTTPNAKWLTVFAKPNPTHTLWHDRYTLAYLLGRHGFAIERLEYYYGNKPNYFLLLKPLLMRQGMFVVARKREVRGVISPAPAQ